MEHKSKIVLMVDQPKLADALNKALDRYQTHFLGPADDVIKKVFDEVPHLLIIDEDFNGGAGKKWAYRIKQDLVIKSIPIIILTNHTSTLIKEKDVLVNYFDKNRFDLKTLCEQLEKTLAENTNELDLNPLTRLPGNRSSVLRLERAMRSKKTYAICCVDLSDLAAYNSVYGDARGDEVIVQLAQILEGELKKDKSEDNFLGHLGGDDFIIVTRPERAMQISEAVTNSFDETIPNFYDVKHRQSGYIEKKNEEGVKTKYPIMSVSVVIIEHDQMPAARISDVGRIAGELKQVLKTLHGSSYIKYRPRLFPDGNGHPAESIEARIPHKAESVKLKTRSHDEDKFAKFFHSIIYEKSIQTFYQPIVELKTKKIIGYEALTRSTADDFMKEPATLFALARESGKIKELDKLCVDCALKTAKDLEPDKKLFLNLNQETLIDPKVMKDIFVERGPISFKNIVIELTEQSILRSFDKVQEAIQGLRAEGVSFAIDDVGGGAVSLRDVAILKPDYIKFDRSLIRQIDANVTKQQIILSLILFANAIQATTTAEGIETPEECATMQMLGITLAQGYYFAKPGKAFPTLAI